MKHLFLLMALTVLPLVACNATSGESSSQTDATTQQGTKADLAFLTKLGIDAGKVALMDDQFGSDNQCEVVSLDDNQTFSLLPMVKRMIMDPEEGIEGGYYIEAARGLASGYTMLLLGVEYGDGANNLLAVYDKNGNLTDLMDLGNWGEFYTVQCNDAMTEGQARVTATQLSFKSSSEFEIAQEVKMCDWTRPAGQAELPSNFTKQYWRRNKHTQYRVDNQGHYAQTGSKAGHEGDIPGVDAILEDIGAIGSLPMSDPRRIDRLNDKAAELTDADADWYYYLRMTLQQMYMQRPEQLLRWIYDNRNRETLVTPMFEQLFSDGYINKSLLVKDITDLNDTTVKKYLETLTAQWGPSQTVG